MILEVQRKMKFQGLSARRVTDDTSNSSNGIAKNERVAVGDGTGNTSAIQVETYLNWMTIHRFLNLTFAPVLSHHRWILKKNKSVVRSVPRPLTRIMRQIYVQIPLTISHQLCHPNRPMLPLSEPAACN